MSNTTFTDGITTIVSSWLNDVNDVVYDVLGDGTNVPTTKAEVRTNIQAAPETTGTSILKGNGTGGFSNASSGTDYQAPIGTITGLAKGNGANQLTGATAGVDYQTPLTAGTDYLAPSSIGVTVQGYDANTVKINVANTFTATQTPDNGTASVSATGTYTFDGADQVREITLTNAITVTFGAPSGITQYAMYKLILKAGDTSARTFAWNSAYKFPSATAPLTSGTTTSDAFDVISFIGGASNTLIYQGHVSDVR